MFCPVLIERHHHQGIQRSKLRLELHQVGTRWFSKMNGFLLQIRNGCRPCPRTPMDLLKRQVKIKRQGCCAIMLHQQSEQFSVGSVPAQVQRWHTILDNKFGKPLTLGLTDSCEMACRNWAFVLAIVTVKDPAYTRNVIAKASWEPKKVQFSRIRKSSTF